MRVIAARSKFFSKARNPSRPRAYSPQLIRIALSLRVGGMPSFVSSFYGNKGTKFANDFQEPGVTQPSLISIKS